MSAATEDSAVVREALAADREALIAGLADLQEVLRALYPPLVEGRVMAEAYLDGLIARGAGRDLAIFVSDEAGRIVGLVAVLVRRGVDPVESTLNDLAHVTDLWIAADRRRRGIGTALLARAERFARERGLSCLEIESLAANVAAADTYRRFGFRDHVLTLRKDLPSRD